jgi:hypothetical protein
MEQVKMIINVNEKYRSNFDGANYMPELFKQGGEAMTVAGRELVTQPKWQPYGKYFTNLFTALGFIARQSLVEDDLELNLSEYLAKLENVTSALTACRGV